MTLATDISTELKTAKNLTTKLKSPKRGTFVATAQGVGRYESAFQKHVDDSVWKVSLAFREPSEGKKKVVLSVLQSNVRRICEPDQLEELLKEFQAKTDAAPTLLSKNVDRILLSHDRRIIGVLGRELHAKLAASEDVERYQPLYDKVVGRIAGEIIAQYVSHSRPVPTDFLQCFKNLRLGIDQVMNGARERALTAREFYPFIKNPPSMDITPQAPNIRGRDLVEAEPAADIAMPRRPFVEVIAELRKRAERRPLHFGDDGWRYPNPQYYQHAGKTEFTK